jgi:hypothetical protein
METILQNIPYVLRLVLSLFALLAVQRVLSRLEIAALAAIVLLALLLGHSPATALEVMIPGMLSLDTIFLGIVVLQVIWLSMQMKEAGILDDLVRGIQERFSSRLSMAMLPAIIGFLPMPGGAYFSAPLVDRCDEDGKEKSIRKNLINYWFRHSWEYWWPLYPGVLLALNLTGMDPLHFALLQSPLSLISIAAGSLLLLMKIQPVKRETPSGVKRGELFMLLSPLLILVTSYSFFRFMDIPSGFLILALSIVITQLFIQMQRPQSTSAWKSILLSRRALNLALVVVLIRGYGILIEGTLPGGGTVMQEISGELSRWGLSPLLLIMALPFISGITTGLAIGFVGAGLPVVLAIIQARGLELLPNIMIAYASGYMGMMLSPVHVCFIVSSEFFSVELLQGIIRLLPVALFSLLSGLVYYLVLVKIL